MVEPHFSMLWNHLIPRHQVRDAAGRTTELAIIAGHYADVKAPAPPPSSWAAGADADVAIWTVEMAPGATWSLPPAAAGSNRSLYFFRGSKLRVGGRELASYQRAQLQADATVLVENGDETSELLLLQGRPIGEPVVQQGPFVMNTPDEIRQAFAEFRRTRFGGWPWPTHDPVHPADEGRFARHADGRTERPQGP
jgi:hypothetical protein